MIIITTYLEEIVFYMTQKCISGEHQDNLHCGLINKSQKTNICKIKSKKGNA